MDLKISKPTIDGVVIKVVVAYEFSIKDAFRSGT